MHWDDSTFTPLLVLIESEQWTARSMESVLTPLGWAVIRAPTGTGGLDLLQRLTPDLILVDRDLPDMDTPEVLRRIGELPTVGLSTPRCLISTSTVSREERLDALREGAWEVLTPPFHWEELAVRLDTWLSAKREADSWRDQGMLDPLTGLYNLKGLLRRVDELVSDASRHERSISFVAIGLNEATAPEEGDATSETLARALGTALDSETRLSDAVGRVGSGEFVIVAPGIDDTGAEGLVNRLFSQESFQGLRLRAGISSAAGRKDQPIPPLDLLDRATQALRKAQAGNGNGNGGLTPQ